MNTLKWSLADCWVLTLRNMKKLFREPDSLAVSLGLPVMLMMMFVYVFGGAIQTGTSYINYVVPGIITTCVGYSSSLVAMAVNKDLTGGLHARLRTMAVRPLALLFSHVFGSLLRNALSAMLVIAAAIAIGFRPNAGWIEWVAASGMLLLFLLAFSWLGVLFGLLAKTPETAGALAMSGMFLPYVSSAFVPTDTMPRWLAAFAEHQPMTPLIESLRMLLTGIETTESHFVALIWLVGILLASCLVSLIVYASRFARSV